VDLFWKIIDIDWPSKGRAARAFTGSVFQAVFIAIEWSIRPANSSLVSCDIIIKCLPFNDDEDDDIDRRQAEEALGPRDSSDIVCLPAPAIERIPWKDISLMDSVESFSEMIDV